MPGPFEEAVGGPRTHQDDVTAQVMSDGIRKECYISNEGVKELVLQIGREIWREWGRSIVKLSQNYI